MLESHHYWKLFFPYGAGFEFLFFDTLAVLFVLAFFDRERPSSARNLDLVMLVAWVPLGDYERGNVTSNALLAYLILYYFLGRFAWLVHAPLETSVTCHLDARGLKAASLGLLVYSLFLVGVSPWPYAQVGKKGHEISDSGAAGMAGARVILSGKPVYGNTQELQTSKGRNRGWDTYGPGYYYLFVPFEAMAGAGGDPKKGYGLSARWTTLALHLLCLACLFGIGSRMGGRDRGLAFVFAWSILPYVFINLYWCSTGHLLPGALSLLALWLFLRGPVAGGVGLGYLAASAFYPLFLLPIWAAALQGRARFRFVIVTFVTGLILWLPQLAQESGFQKFWEATFEFQEGYRGKPWSPWTHHPEMLPLRHFFSLMFLPVVGFLTYLVSRKGWKVWLPATCLVLVWMQLYKLHAPGRFQLWLFPFFLPLLLGGTPPEPREGS